MNIALRFQKFAQIFPDKKAIVDGSKSHYPSLTFSELNSLAQNYAHGLTEIGFKEGMKTLLFVRPGLDFIALTLALFKMGVIPIMIDPAMGRTNLLQAIKKVKPDGMISEPIVHMARFLFPKSFKSVKYFVTTSKVSFLKAKNLTWLKNRAIRKAPFQTVPKKHEDMAAILFTSGGTGVPKGVEYTHLIFNAQTDILQKLFNLTPDDIDMPGFPLFSFFTMSMGMTSVLPNMNVRKPAHANSKKLLKNINDFKPSFVAGSPAIWKRLADYCSEKKITLPSIKRLVMFGAPVSLEIHEKFATILTNGTTYTPYGATECLPVANISGLEILTRHRKKTLEGAGVCLGKPAPNIHIKIIKHSDDSITDIHNTYQCETNEMGEIIVKGDVVTRRYHLMEDETNLAKIYDSSGNLWHRTGDLGHFDNDGNLWFEGRKSHRVETKEGTLTTIPIELRYNQHPKIKKSALIGVGKQGHQTPSLVIETKKHIDLSDIKNYTNLNIIEKFYTIKKFPVDVRHNIKIDRLLLKNLAEQKKLKEIIT